MVKSSSRATVPMDWLSIVCRTRTATAYSNRFGRSWYRPARLCHVIPGGEYGWRSGWSKWPEHYFDSLPPVIETGRGSPAGIAAYNHFMFPVRYHGALFTADWSQGKILAVKLKR